VEGGEGVSSTKLIDGARVEQGVPWWLKDPTKERFEFTRPLCIGDHKPPCSHIGFDERPPHSSIRKTLHVRALRGVTFVAGNMLLSETIAQSLRTYRQTDIRQPVVMIMQNVNAWTGWWVGYSQRAQWALEQLIEITFTLCIDDVGQFALYLHETAELRQGRRLRLMLP
jgi:hypothetical protein